MLSKRHARCDESGFCDRLAVVCFINWQYTSSRSVKCLWQCCEESKTIDRINAIPEVDENEGGHFMYKPLKLCKHIWLRLHRDWAANRHSNVICIRSIRWPAVTTRAVDVIMGFESVYLAISPDRHAAGRSANAFDCGHWFVRRIFDCCRKKNGKDFDFIAIFGWYI